MQIKSESEDFGEKRGIFFYTKTSRDSSFLHSNHLTTIIIVQFITFVQNQQNVVFIASLRNSSVEGERGHERAQHWRLLPQTFYKPFRHGF